MSRDTWETILFFSSIMFACASFLLVFGAGAALVLLDYRPIMYAIAFWCLSLVIQFIAGANSE